MIKVIKQNERVYLLLDKPDQGVMKSLEGFNKAGVDVLTLIDPKEELYCVNNTDMVARLSLSGKVVSLETNLSGYYSRRERLLEQRMSFFS